MTRREWNRLGYALLPWDIVGYYWRDSYCHDCQVRRVHTWENHDCNLIWAGVA